MAATWKLHIQKASWRGVPFEVYSASRETGRQTVVHTFPHGTAPFVEDLGEVPQSFELQGFVSGPSYMRQRDRLEAAFAQKGAGTLVHPWYGSLYAALAAPVKGTHSAADGGMYSFTARFVRVEKRNGLTASPNLLQKIHSAAVKAADMAQGVADTVARVRDFGHWCVAQVDLVVGSFRSAVRSITGIGDDLRFLADDLGHIFERGSFGAECAGLVSAAAASLPEKSSPAPLLRLAEAAPDAAVPDTAGLGTSRTAVAHASAAVAQVWQLCAVSEACRLAALYTPQTAGEASQLQGRIVDAIARAQDCADDETFAALSDLRAVTLQAMAERARTAPDVIEITEAQSLPSLAVAYKHTGDVTAADDLVRRNGVRHPAFVPAGTPLELLHD